MSKFRQLGPQESHDDQRMIASIFSTLWREFKLSGDESRGHFLFSEHVRTKGTFSPCSHISLLSVFQYHHAQFEAYRFYYIDIIWEYLIAQQYS